MSCLILFQDELNPDLVVEELVETVEVLNNEFVIICLLDVEL